MFRWIYLDKLDSNILLDFLEDEAFDDLKRKHNISEISALLNSSLQAKQLFIEW